MCLAVSPDWGYVYASSSNAVSSNNGYLEKFSIPNLVRVGSGIAGVTPISVAVSPDTNNVYVVNREGNTLQRFDSQNLTPLQQINVATEPIKVVVSQ